MSNTKKVDAIREMYYELEYTFFKHLRVRTDRVERYCAALIEASSALEPWFAVQLINIAEHLRMRVHVSEFDLGMLSEHDWMLIDLRWDAKAEDDATAEQK
jgi:hypothetical protein